MLRLFSSLVISTKEKIGLLSIEVVLGVYSDCYLITTTYDGYYMILCNEQGAVINTYYRVGNVDTSNLEDLACKLKLSLGAIPITEYLEILNNSAKFISTLGDLQ